MARANAFWPTAVVGEADRVNSVSASACHIGGPKALLRGINIEGPMSVSLIDDNKL